MRRSLDVEDVGHTFAIIDELDLEVAQVRLEPYRCYRLGFQSDVWFRVENWSGHWRVCLRWRIIDEFFNSYIQAVVRQPDNDIVTFDIFEKKKKSNKDLTKLKGKTRSYHDVRNRTNAYARVLIGLAE